jgi:hypothetical protein
VCGISYWRHPQSPNWDLRLLTTKNSNKTRTRTLQLPLTLSTSETFIIRAAARYPLPKALWTSFAGLRFQTQSCPVPCGSHRPRLCSAQTLAANGVVLLPSNASSFTFAAPAFHHLDLWPQYSDRNHGRHTGHQHCPHQLVESWLVHPRSKTRCWGCSNRAEPLQLRRLFLLTASSQTRLCEMRPSSNLPTPLRLTS